MEFLNAANIDNISIVAVLAAVAIAVITDKLVWHTRLKAADARAARWEKIALDALASGAHAGVRAAEVAAEVVCAIPDPEMLRQRARSAADREDG